MKSTKLLNTIEAGCIYLLMFGLFSGCAPYIKSFNPESGTSGTLVNINGGRFSSTAAGNTVKFANAVVPTSDITVTSTSKLKVKVPTGATTGLISVSTSKGIGKSNKNFIINNQSPKWTFMVYLDADNNLEYAGIDDFLEMSSVGSNSNINIVIQMDRITGHSDEYGNWTGTRRFLIQSGDTPSITPVMDLGEQNMGDPNTLSDFVEWAITNYPADHYALSIWNHGDGWRLNRNIMDSLVTLNRSGYNETLVKAVASDDTDGDILYMREVQDALSLAKTNLDNRNNTNVKLDVVGFDACLMGMIEVAYAIRSVANYMVGSEELEPGDGWPYNTILADLNSNPNMTAEEFAKTIVVKYEDSYSSGVTQSTYDLSELNNLTSSINNFTGKATTDWTVLKSARNNSRDYHISYYTQFWGTDLWDFADEVYNSTSNVDIKNASADLKNAIDAFVVEEKHSSDMSGSHGVAIYFPPDQSSFNNDPQHTGYLETNTFMVVDFVAHHTWDNWLQDYYINIP